MMTSNGSNNSDAFGHPGIHPRWTHGDKDGGVRMPVFGMARSEASK